MSLFRVFDAAFPPGRPYPGCGAVAGYIGGNTPHVWTAHEWNAASDNGRLAMLPIWVGFGEADPVDHARQAAAAARRLGWAAHHQPAWRAIAADVENVSEEAWLRAFGRELQAEGFLCWPYMSIVALPSDPPGFTVWAAEWNGQADVPPVHDVIGHQYAHDLPFEGTSVDLSMFEGAAVNSFGRGPRRLAGDCQPAGHRQPHQCRSPVKTVAERFHADHPALGVQVHEHARGRFDGAGHAPGTAVAEQVRVARLPGCHVPIIPRRKDTPRHARTR